MNPFTLFASSLFLLLTFSLKADLVVNVDPFKREYYLSGTATGTPYEDELFATGNGEIFWNSSDPTGSENDDFLSLEAFTVTNNVATRFSMFIHSNGNINGLIELETAATTTLAGNPNVKYSYADFHPDLITEIEDKAETGELIPMISSAYDDAFILRFAKAEPDPPLIDVFVGIEIDGALGLTYRIEYSEDGENWQALADVVLTSTPYIYYDPTVAVNLPNRLYRITLAE